MDGRRGQTRDHITGERHGGIGVNVTGVVQVELVSARPGLDVYRPQHGI